MNVLGLFKKASLIAVMCSSLGLFFAAQAAPLDVSVVYGDEGGSLWTSNTIMPQTATDSNHLLGVTTADGTFSTGVNDGLLTGGSISFTPQIFKALPVTKITLGGNIQYIGIPYNLPSSPVPPAALSPVEPLYHYMTDGTQGLELGTAIFNDLNRTTHEYALTIPNDDVVTDTIPDLISTQVGAISGTNTFRLLDSAGLLVGNAVTVSYASATANPLYVANYKFYRASTAVWGALGPTRNGYMSTLKFSDFGINAGNFSNVVKLVQVPSQQADIAFTAYNWHSMTINPTDLAVTAAITGLSCPIQNSETATITLTVRNNGTHDAINFGVNAALPAGLTYVSDNGASVAEATYDAANGRWQIDRLNVGDSMTLTITATASGQAFDFTASILGMLQGDPDTSNNTAVVGRDSDCDGVADSDDLDDDNDGISDVMECPSLVTSTLDWSSSAWTAGSLTGSYTVGGESIAVSVTDASGALLPSPPAPVALPASGALYRGNQASPDDALNFAVLLTTLGTSNNLTITLDLGTAGSGLDNVSFSLFDVDGELGSYFRQEKYTISGELSGSAVSPTITPLGSQVVTGNVVRGFVPVPVDEDGSEQGVVKVAFDSAVDKVTIVFEIESSLPSFSATSRPGFALYDIQFNKACDTDGDGIPNHLDLDSDGDGCADALEGNNTLNFSDLDLETRINSAVDSNGQPTPIASSIGSSQDKNIRAGECNACDPTSSLFADADSDGVGDRCDLDDDNDGILDVVEGCTLPNSVGNSFSPLTVDSANGTMLTLSDTAGASWGSSFSYPLADPVVTIDASQNHIYLKTVSSVGDNLVTYTFNQPVRANQLALFVYDVDLYQDLQLTFAGGTASGSDFIQSHVLGYTTPFPNMRWDGTAAAAHHVINGSDPNTQDNYLFIYGNSDATLTSITIATADLDITDFPAAVTSIGNYLGATLYFRPLVDTDKDGIIDCLDEDSDNDGCYDALEGDSTTIIETTDMSVVNSDGVPTAAGAGQGIGQARTAGQVTINTQPADTTAYAGDAVTITAAATATRTTTFVSGTPDYATGSSTTPLYQWYESTDGGSTWNEMSGQTSNHLNLLSVTVGMNDNQYRVEVSCAENQCPTLSNLATLTVLPAVGLTISKFGALDDSNSNGYADAGETLGYVFTLNNTGNAVLHNITINDPLLGGAVTCDPALPATILVGASFTCHAVQTYPLTQAMIDNGNPIDNTVTVTANDGTGSTNPKASASQTANASVSLVQDPSYNMVKTVNPTTISAQGTLTYMFTFTNNGNVVLTDLTVADSNIDAGTLTCNNDADSDGDIDSLAVGATEMCTATRAITQADFDSGADIVNTATPSAQSSSGTPAETATSDNTATTTVTQNPAFSLAKTAGAVTDVNSNGIVDAGDTIVYSFAASNTGNVTLTVTGVSDAKLPSLSCTPASLPVGASNQTLTCSNNTYTLTTADISAGQVQNTATATATDPNSDPLTAEASVNTPLTETPQFNMVKTVNPTTISAPATLTYTFTFTNNGNVVLTDLTVADSNIDAGTLTCNNDADSDGDIDSLAVGAVETCTATRIVTQADFDSGADIVNTATPSAQSSNGTPAETATSDNTATTTITASNNMPPVANDDSGQTQAGQSVSIAVLDNDSDSDGRLNPASVAIVAGNEPKNGSVSIDSRTGAITYTPKAGFSGKDTFVYQVCNNDSPTPICVTAEVVVTVLAVITAPKPVPALSRWAVAVMTLVLAILSIAGLRRLHFQ